MSKHFIRLATFATLALSIHAFAQGNGHGPGGGNSGNGGGNWGGNNGNGHGPGGGNSGNGGGNGGGGGGAAPEPATMLLIGAGAGAVGVRRYMARRSKRSKNPKTP